MNNSFSTTSVIFFFTTLVFTASTCGMDKQKSNRQTRIDTHIPVPYKKFFNDSRPEKPSYLGKAICEEILVFAEKSTQVELQNLLASIEKQGVEKSFASINTWYTPCEGSPRRNNLSTLVSHSIIVGDASLIQRLIYLKADVRPLHAFMFNNDLIHQAMETNNIECVAHLLAAGAQPLRDDIKKECRKIRCAQFAQRALIQQISQLKTNIPRDRMVVSLIAQFAFAPEIHKAVFGGLKK